MNNAMRRKIFISGIIFVIILTIIYGFLPKARQVDMVTVTRGPMQVTIEEEGRTRLKERFTISAPTSGYMRRIDSKTGDPVKKGQTVVILDPLRSQSLDPRSRAEAEVTISAVEASLNAAIEKESAASADADYTEKRLERIRNLYSKAYIAKDQFEQIESEAKKARAVQRAAKAAIDVARSELARAKTTLQNYSPVTKAGNYNAIYVSSPVGGNIFRIYRESEGAVSAGEPLIDIGNSKNLEIRVEVLSSDAVKIEKGTNVMFKRWGREEPLTGRVRIVEPAGFTKISSLGVEEQRVLIIVDITSPPELWHVLGDGYRLEAHFIVWEGEDILQVPTSALFRSGKDWAVFMEQKGKARCRLVEVGQRTGLTAQILSGLKEKERVIAYPDDSVKEGTRIDQRK